MSLEAAVDCVLQGKLCIYPTETFFALGCDACNARAVEELLRVKQRPKEQGLPVIIGHRRQLPLVCDLRPGSAFPETLRELALQLMQRFWPGSLSLVLPAASGLAEGVPRQGSVAVRLTPHPAAQSLCSRTERPLVASSANARAEPPVCQAKNLNPLVRQAAAEVLDAPPSPSGGQPSTLVHPVLDADGSASVQIVRLGAVSVQQLQAAGFPVATFSVSDG